MNGTGKTNILKIINGVIPSDTGEVSLGSNVEIGYFDQQSAVLTDTKTVFEEISDAYPEMTETGIRNMLAGFLFTKDEVFAPISTLSGGERGRVVLAKLMLSGANFLILDEPTNHLDMISKEVLENALNAYPGTLLYVSHDRYFINRTAERILCLENGVLTGYLGNYDYYLEKSSEDLNNLKQELQRVNAELSNYDEALRAKEQQLSEKVNQNMTFIKLLHQSELEGKAEDVIYAIRQSSTGKKNMKAADWKQLYQAVDELYPTFKDRLLKELGTFTEQQMQVCYLMRIGLSKPQIQNMTNLSRVTVWRWVKKYDWVLTPDNEV